MKIVITATERTLQRAYDLALRAEQAAERRHDAASTSAGRERSLAAYSRAADRTNEAIRALAAFRGDR